MRFTRNLYPKEGKYFVPKLERIEQLYEEWKKLPQSAVLKFTPADTFKMAADDGDGQALYMHFINDVARQIEFLYYTSYFTRIGFRCRAGPRHPKTIKSARIFCSLSNSPTTFR
jgi:hypothetical protein